jgi:ribosomal protein S18 acetylase RimI-like enzyme
VTSKAPLFTVRSASASDVQALSDLEHEARLEITTFRGHESLLQENVLISPNWAKQISSESVLVFVAESSGQIVGYAKGDISVESSSCVVNHIYVDPMARQIGIGAGLITEIARIAKSRGCTTLDALALPGDRKMKNLYERVGMPARLLVASKTL